jgi:hypothetical protein
MQNKDSKRHELKALSIAGNLGSILASRQPHTTPHMHAHAGTHFIKWFPHAVILQVFNVRPWRIASRSLAHARQRAFKQRPKI